MSAHTPRESLNADGRRRLVQVFSMVVIYALFLFIPAGTFRWWNAWVYLGLFVISILTAGIYVARRHPEIVNERGRRSDKTKPFDKVFGRLTVPLALGAYVVAGLDFRFGWSAVPLWMQVAGMIGLLPSLFMPYWVMNVNAYAATTVRVETGRGHHVITSGPYRYVRHPMYITTIIGCLFDPAAFGSWWMAIPTFLLAVLLVWRTANEDRTLMADLPGYREYAARTRFRLVPGLW